MPERRGLRALGVGLLAAVGYRLDLKRCVASGETADLAYVSPNQVGRWRFIRRVFCQPHAYVAQVFGGRLLH